MSIKSYRELYEGNTGGFELMEHTANALMLQFNEPIIYDLTIPDGFKIKRMLQLYLDDWRGNVVRPSEVNCCYPLYDKRNVEVDFGGKYSSVVERGLEFCFNTKDKYDTLPLIIHLDTNPEIFGREVVSGKGVFYRFREGVKDNIRNNVGIYFGRGELKAFEDIVSFVKPYIKNLDKPAKVSC